LDSGSRSNFITEDLVCRLGLTTRSINIPIVGINHSWSHAQEIVKVNVKSKHCAFHTAIECLVLKRISDRSPNVQLDKTSFKIPQNLYLADPTFYRSTDIEILLGTQVFWNVLYVGQIKASPKHPLLQKTLFGGKCAHLFNDTKAQQCSLFIGASTASLENAISKLWQVDQVNNSLLFTAEEIECEEHFKKTYDRDHQGRFIVELQLKQGVLQSLGNSYEIA